MGRYSHLAALLVLENDLRRNPTGRAGGRASS